MFSKLLCYHAQNPENRPHLFGIGYASSVAGNHRGNVLNSEFVLLERIGAHPDDRHARVLLQIVELAALGILRTVKIDLAIKKQRRNGNCIRRARSIGRSENGIVGMFYDVPGLLLGQKIILATDLAIRRLCCGRLDSDALGSGVDVERATREQKSADRGGRQKSANTANLHELTLLFENIPTWKACPCRLSNWARK